LLQKAVARRSQHGAEQRRADDGTVCTAHPTGLQDWPLEFYFRSGLGAGTRKKLEDLAKKDLKK